MHALQLLGLMVPLTCLLAVSAGGAPGASTAQSKLLAEGNTAFALDLYSQLKSNPGNIFFSPYSISTCLAMTYAGARGDTERQMRQVLHFGENQKEVHSAFGEVQRRLKEEQKGVQLTIANALWAQEGHPFMPAFLAIAREDYQANVNQANFKTAAEPTRSRINRWVAEKTKDKIQEILPPGSLNASTRLVLANAIYFKGLWEVPFAKPQTRTEPFHLAGGSSVDAPLMHHVDSVKYLDEADFQAVELPYSSNEVAMVVLLPRQVDGCAGLESRLTPAFLSHAIEQMKKQKVDLTLPRFKLESSLQLKDRLAKLGMADAFDVKADFSAMDGARDLYISEIFHKAWGEVNEEGTEAAAATAGVIALTSARPSALPAVFRADHPFIFLIRDTRSGSLLFLGRFSSPAS
jgi:serpin B